MLDILKLIGDDFGNGPSEVCGDRQVVNLCEALVQADKTEIAIEEAEADGSAVVDGIELGEALGGQGFEPQGQV